LLTVAGLGLASAGWAQPPDEPLLGGWERVLPRTALADEDSPGSERLPPLPLGSGPEWGVLPSQRIEWDLDGSRARSPNRLAKSIHLPLGGPLFVFGQFDAAGDPTTNQAARLASRSGLGCKVPLPVRAEVLVRTGPNVTWLVPSRPDHVLAPEAPLFVEMQCRCPLPGDVGLEYVGSAVPALEPTAHNRLEQDLRLVVPLRPDWQLKVGAKHIWQGVQEWEPLSTGLQFYVGSGMKW
jgi:hypothetical protein